MLYDKNGYINISDILSHTNEGIYFYYVVGGRATGKTYGALKYVIEHGLKFIYMRRTQTQTDLINKKEFSPVNPIMRDTGKQITVKPLSKYNAAFIYNDIIIGYTAALSTIANMRGFDASEVQIIIYDEFIPERHERSLKYEYNALLNAYETVNRNRELSGSRPLILMCLANANDLTNDIFIDAGLSTVAEKMKRKEQILYIDAKRHRALYLLDNSPISQQKKHTALYENAAETKFSAMSLQNSFDQEEPDKIRYQPIIEYICILEYDGVYFYKHKSRKQYYITRTGSGAPARYEDSNADRARIRDKYRRIFNCYMSGRVIFADQAVRKKFLTIWGIL